MQAKREQWSGFSKTTQASRLVFQAESEVNINMARWYGRGQGGRRVVARAPLNIPKSTTILICTLCFVQCCMWCRVEYNGECYQVTTPNGRVCILGPVHISPNARLFDQFFRLPVKNF